MHKVFISRRGFEDLMAIPQDKRQAFAKALLGILETDSALKPLQGGDAQAASLELPGGFQAIFRKFAGQDKTASPVWILSALVLQDLLSTMAASLRFAWDGETVELVRVVPNTGLLTPEQPFQRFTIPEFSAWGVPDKIVSKIQNSGEEDELRAFEGDLSGKLFFQLLDTLETYKQYPEDLTILDDKLPRAQALGIEDEILESLEDLFHSDRFAVLESPALLQRMLNSNPPVWSAFALPDQRKWMTRNFKGPVLIRGVAGSGKTSLALLRTKYLAEEILEDNNDWILLTTPYRYATKFMQEDLQRIGCPHLDRIEINDVYSWAKEFLEKQDIKFEVDAAQSLELLKEAIDASRAGMPNMTNAHLDFNFVRDEIAMVIKGRALHGQPDYLALSRRGFGTPLNSEERRQIWRIYLKYQALLSTKNLFDHEDLLVETYKRLTKGSVKIRKYASIIVDDTQDVPPVALKIFNHLAGHNPNGVFMLSDVTQKFTRMGEVLSGLGIESSMKAPLMRTNVRNTSEIITSALTVLGTTPFEDLDGGAATAAVAPEVKRRGSPPVVALHESEDQNILWILELINDLNRNLGYAFGDILLLARTNKFLTLLDVNLTQAQVPCHNFRKFGHDRSVNKVKLCTYQDSRGLESPVVILTEATEGILPQLPAGIDAEELVSHLSREQRLFYNGLVRARDLVYVTGLSGAPSRFLATLPAAIETETTYSETTPDADEHSAGLEHSRE